MGAFGRVTLRDIALRAGVSHVAVSLALRDHFSIPSKTRARIKSIAEKLGYRPDPALSSLNAYRLKSNPTRYEAILAWIDSYPLCAIPAIEDPKYLDYYCWHGALKQAEQLGFKLEVFRLCEEGMNAARLSNILKSRRIQGVILAPMPIPETPIDLQWDYFSTVALGLSHQPIFHVVCSSQYRNARLAVRKTYELGYRKIGHLTWSNVNKRTDLNFSAGYWAEASSLGIKPAILEFPEPPAVSSLPVIEKWLSRHKVDLMLVHDTHFISLLKKLGYRVPEDIGVAIFNQVPKHPGYAGIYQYPELVGQAAVNYVAGLIHRNEKGLPEHPLRLLIDGVWIAGGSVKSRR